MCDLVLVLWRCTVYLGINMVQMCSANHLLTLQYSQSAVEVSFNPAAASSLRCVTLSLGGREET